MLIYHCTYDYVWFTMVCDVLPCFLTIHIAIRVLFVLFSLCCKTSVKTAVGTACY